VTFKVKEIELFAIADSEGILLGKDVSPGENVSSKQNAGSEEDIEEHIIFEVGSGDAFPLLRDRKPGR
jgi:hypothetical protein